MSPAHRQTQGEQLASQLNAVMNSKKVFSGRLSGFTLAEGAPQEGVPLGRQRLGTLSSGDVEVDLDLVRVSDPSAGKIWLISSDTLTKIPELYDQVEARQVESKLPSVLVKNQVAGVPLWQWLAMLVALPVLRQSAGSYCSSWKFPYAGGPGGGASWRWRTGDRYRVRPGCSPAHSRIRSSYAIWASLCCRGIIIFKSPQSL